MTLVELAFRVLVVGPLAAAVILTCAKFVEERIGTKRSWWKAYLALVAFGFAIAQIGGRIIGRF